MKPVLAAACWALGAAMLLSFYRVMRGPSHFDRLTGLGLIGTKTTVLLVIVGSWMDRTAYFVDLALTYSLISFVGTLAIARYFERAAPPDRVPPAGPLQSPGPR